MLPDLQCALTDESVCVYHGLSSIFLEGPATNTGTKSKRSHKTKRYVKSVYSNIVQEVNDVSCDN